SHPAAFILMVKGCSFLFLETCKGGKKSYSGPCGGRDCSAGCKCFPEKGARVSLFRLIQLVLLFNLSAVLPEIILKTHPLSENKRN
uniref:Uncharacterized protein n=1 Tax=Cyanoderma ruficeps TaxID=181631 RepID=A0A8C3REP9_9PASS